MLKKIFDGLLIGSGIFISLSVLFGIVYAVGFHPAQEILTGTFLGDYIFNGNVTFNGNVSGLKTEVINESVTENLIRIGDLQIIWGTVLTGTGGVTVTFNETFVEIPNVVVSSNERSGYICSTGNGGVSDTTKTQTTIYSGYTNTCTWIAIGKWQ